MSSKKQPKQRDFLGEIVSLRDEVHSWKSEATRFKNKWLALDKRHDKLLKVFANSVGILVVTCVFVLAWILHYVR